MQAVSSRIYRNDTDTSNNDILRSLSQIVPMKIQRVLCAMAANSPAPLQVRTGSLPADMPSMSPASRCNSAPRMSSRPSADERYGRTLQLNHRRLDQTNPFCLRRGVGDHLEAVLADVMPRRFTTRVEASDVVQILQIWQAEKLRRFINRIYKQMGIEGYSICIE